MSKELKHEFNNSANLLHKDCMNLMEALKKQDKDNKAILYVGRHFKKVILLYEEYKKTYSRLETIDNANSSEALECLEKVHSRLPQWDLSRNVDQCNIIKQALLKAQEQEKENELLKEIIKSLFDRGCPLHQYIDKDFGLTIEVDDECSIMHLGEYKGINLDEKLKEVLEE